MPERTWKVCNYYIGVDPGYSGGLVYVSDEQVYAVSMPDTEADIWEWFRMLRGCKCFAYIEKVQGYAGDDESGRNGVSMFKFGHSYGLCRMALTAANIPFEEVTPQKWQAFMGVKKNKGDTKTQHKNKMKQKAQQLFPDTKVTLATADALLLAEYCRRMRTNG